jgi:hypothetical protein
MKIGDFRKTGFETKRFRKQNVSENATVARALHSLWQI